MDDIDVNKIYTTTDYTLFKRLEGNRDVSERRAANIRASIADIGPMNTPITVNENFEVIDGQGRLEALEELHLPIRYCFQPGAGIKETRAMNRNMQNWTNWDYVKSYAESGFHEYHDLQELLLKYPKISYVVILSVALGAYNKPSGHKKNAIIDGQFEFKQSYEKCIKELDYLYRFVDMKDEKKIKGTFNNFLYAIRFVYNCEGVDRSRLEEVILSRFDKLPEISTVDGAVEALEKIYNYKLPGANRIFVSEEYKKYLAKVDIKNAKRRRTHE